LTDKSTQDHSAFYPLWDYKMNIRRRSFSQGSHSIGYKNF